MTVSKVLIRTRPQIRLPYLSVSAAPPFAPWFAVPFPAAPVCAHWLPPWRYLRRGIGGDASAAHGRGAWARGARGPQVSKVSAAHRPGGGSRASRLGSSRAVRGRAGGRAGGCGRARTSRGRRRSRPSLTPFAAQRHGGDTRPKCASHRRRGCQAAPYQTGHSRRARCRSGRVAAARQTRRPAAACCCTAHHRAEAVRRSRHRAAAVRRSRPAAARAAAG